ncbi:MAG TPA: polysaccharide biosynthesis protein [Firmicutes bacterium]|nr:polysaccharide biosynthesis protein [Bacillota bacterium]
MERQSFLRGAILLTFAGLASKVLGAIYLVPLTRLIGPEGVGLYQMSYPIYGIMLVLSASGLPVAISKMVAERAAHHDHAGAERVFRVAFFFLLLAGLVFSILLYGAAGFIARRFLGDPRSYYTVKSIAPAVFLVAVMSAFRGYFQGLGTMLPTALSQLSEQVVRVVLALALAYILLPKGVEFSAAGSAMGAVGGALTGFVVLTVIYLKDKQSGRHPHHMGHHPVESHLSLTKSLLAFAIPATIGSLVAPAADLANAAIIPARFQAAGLDVREATSLYGQLAAMGMSLISFPTVFTTAFATSLVPAIAGSISTGDIMSARARAQEAMRFTLMIAVPSFVGLRELAAPIADLLFGCPGAGAPLAVLAPGTVFLCIQQTSSGILQGLGKPAQSARNLLIGLGSGVVLNYYLAGVPSLTVRGAALGIVAGLAIACLLNFAMASRLLGGIISTVSTARVLLASVLIQPVIRYAYSYMLSWSPSRSMATASCILVTVISYFAILLLTHEITPGEFAGLPYISRLVAVFHRRT